MKVTLPRFGGLRKVIESEMNSFSKISVCFLLCLSSASAQLVVTVSPLKIAGSKAVLPLAIKNGFSEKVESARAVVFVTDEQGKVVGHATRWVVGGTKDRPALEAGKETTFNFVVAGERPFTTTNLTAKVSFNRVVLERGKLADPAKDVQIQNSK
jgi:hypothetical protein